MGRANPCDVFCRNGSQCRYPPVQGFEGSGMGGAGRQPLLELYLLGGGQTLFPTSVPVNCGHIHGVLLAEELLKLARLRSLVEGG